MEPSHLFKYLLVQDSMECCGLGFYCSSSHVGWVGGWVGGKGEACGFKFLKQEPMPMPWLLVKLEMKFCQFQGVCVQLLYSQLLSWNSIQNCSTRAPPCKLNRQQGRFEVATYCIQFYVFTSWAISCYKTDQEAVNPSLVILAGKRSQPNCLASPTCYIWQLQPRGECVRAI